MGDHDYYISISLWHIITYSNDTYYSVNMLQYTIYANTLSLLQLYVTLQLQLQSTLYSVHPLQ